MIGPVIVWTVVLVVTTVFAVVRVKKARRLSRMLRLGSEKLADAGGLQAKIDWAGVTSLYALADEPNAGQRELLAYGFDGPILRQRAARNYGLLLSNAVLSRSDLYGNSVQLEAVQRHKKLFRDEQLRQLGRRP